MNSNPCNASAFGAVGESPLSYVGSGKAPANSKYTKKLPKNSMGTGTSPTGEKGVRANKKMPETGGPKCEVVATLYHQNAAEASAQQRNTYLLPSKAGVGDFWAERSRQGQVI